MKVNDNFADPVAPADANLLLVEEVHDNKDTQCVAGM
jgi:hypothetical protein